jgi:hypothetical protein
LIEIEKTFGKILILITFLAKLNLFYCLAICVNAAREGSMALCEENLELREEKENDESPARSQYFLTGDNDPKSSSKSTVTCVFENFSKIWAKNIRGTKTNFF